MDSAACFAAFRRRASVLNRMEAIRFDSADLAPGDGKSSAFDPASVEVHRIDTLENPLFAEAYSHLWEQFGAANELEPAEVLSNRLTRTRDCRSGEMFMQYELLLLKCAGAFVGVCDHTACISPREVIVHLSHHLIAPEWRRTGLGGWLRAFPLQLARRSLRNAGLPMAVPVTLVAEAEYPDGIDESRIVRLKAYERAGFQKIDPDIIQYHQPDFRPPRLIDETGGPESLPLQLIIRRVGREAEKYVSGFEARTIVERLYGIYARDLREEEMVVVGRLLDAYPSADTLIRLLPPSA